jgi:plasmid stabilization system protein ParE
MESNLSYSLLISSKAQSEMARAWLWYEDRESVLGDRFIDAVRQKVKTVVKNPDLFSIKHNPYREVLVSVFPFVIVYKIYRKKKLIEIVSVFRTSRNPERKH